MVYNFGDVERKIQTLSDKVNGPMVVVHDLHKTLAVKERN